MFKNIIFFAGGKGQLKKGLEYTPDILKLLIPKNEEIHNSIGQDVDHELDIPCPASCEGNLSIAFNNNEPDFINKLVSRSQCTLCGLEIFTDEMINEYVMKFINEDKILKSFGLKK